MQIATEIVDIFLPSMNIIRNACALIEFRILRSLALTNTNNTTPFRMGSYPSHEQAVYPAAPSNESDLSTRQHLASPVRRRSRHGITKKFTRGRVLVVGLDGAGKTTLVNQLVRRATEEGHHANISTFGLSEDTFRAADDNRPLKIGLQPDPTKVVQIWSYRLDGDRYLQIGDMPGRRTSRAKWYTTTSASMEANNQTTMTSSGQNSLPLLGIVYVVDASDSIRFPLVAQELVRLQYLKDEKKAFQKAQFFLILNKLDRVITPIHPPQNQSPSKKTSQRLAMREVRRELKKCVDHQFYIDQKRNPSFFKREVIASGPTSSAAPGISHRAAKTISNRTAPAESDTIKLRKSSMLTSIMESCAHDPESIKAIHLWLKGELKKSM